MTAMTPGSNIPLTAARVAVDVAAPVRLDVSGLLLTADGKVRSDDDFIFYNQPTGPGVTYRSGGGTTPTRSRSTPPPCPRASRRSSSPRARTPRARPSRASSPRPRSATRTTAPSWPRSRPPQLGSRDGPGDRRGLPAQRRLEGPRGGPGVRERPGRHRDGLRRERGGAGRGPGRRSRPRSSPRRPRRHRRAPVGPVSASARARRTPGSPRPDPRRRKDQPRQGPRQPPEEPDRVPGQGRPAAALPGQDGPRLGAGVPAARTSTWTRRSSRTARSATTSTAATSASSPS